MTRRFGLVSAALIATIVGCAGSPEEGRDTAETQTESLGGTPITIADESTTTDGMVKTELSANGERVAVSFDGKTLTVRDADRGLTLRRDGDVVAIAFDYTAQGEHVVSSAPVAERALDAQMADARGKLSPSSALRHGTLVPVAAHAITTWAPENRLAAEALLASFVGSLPHGSATTVTPKMMPMPDQCIQGTGCSIRSSGGYSCSVSCTQGWIYENCATCSTSSDGRAYCECSW
jgi:hypothetical protein